MEIAKQASAGFIKLLIYFVLLVSMPVAATESTAETIAEAAAVASETMESTTETAETAAKAVKAATETMESTAETATKEAREPKEATTATRVKAASEPTEPIQQETEEICDISTIDTVFKEYAKESGPEQIKRMQAQLKVGGYDPGYIDGLTGDDTDRALQRLCVDFKVDEYFKANESTATEKPTKSLAEHLIRLLYEPYPIDLSGGGCGCSRDFSTRVYGFYPYLLARGEPQVVDFSLLDRIAFHALVLDKEGGIQDRLQWGNDSGNVASFINEAHQHRVKVDITFYASEWHKWEYGVIDKAAKNIVVTVKQKFHTPDTSLWGKILQLLGNTSTVGADGVNLYFDYNVKSGNSKKLSQIVNKVFEELKDAGSDAKLNIMLGLDLPDIDKRQFAELKRILVGDFAAVEKVFIFLPENTVKSKKKTSKAKKGLRQIVENAFSGDRRTTVLRKIVPIITPAEPDFEPLLANDEGDTQFDDDLVYLEDNFAGLGLWPLPLESRSDTKEISKALIKQYQANDGLNYVGERFEDYAPSLCEFVCPNRMLFYVGIGLLVGILVIYALLALWNCRLREIYQRNFLYFVALFLFTPLILLISLACDPAWEKYVDRVVISSLLLFIVGIVWRNVRKVVQPKLP